MSNIAVFPSFIPSYNMLLENKEKIYVVEFYHRDVPSEPTVSIINKVDEIFAHFGDDAYISIRFAGGTDLSFNADSYHTNISDNTVVFSSKYDDETYCFIEFKERT